MSGGIDGPCDWPVDHSCCTDVFGSASPAVTGAAVSAATAALWAAGGRQHGQCEVTLRPCRRECWGGYGSWIDSGADWGSPFPGFPNVVGGWLALSCGGCAGSCSCTFLSEVVLPGGADSVSKVTIDSVDLDTDDYRLDNGRLLVRQDGERWPLCQDLSRPAGEVGTWTVTALYGRAVPPLGALAAGELTCEIIKSCIGGECRLPRRHLQTVSRQGVVEVFLDPLALANAGLMGLDLCDTYIQTYNPGRLRSRPIVMSPDVPRPRG